MVHGEEDAMKARETAEELFGNKKNSDNMPSVSISKKLLDIRVVDLLVEVNLVSSKSEAKRLIEQNGVSINQEKVKSVEQFVTDKDLKDNSLVLQKGKKVFLKVHFEDV